MIQFNVPTEVLKSVKHYRLLSYTRQVAEVANEKNFEHMHAHAEIFFITGGKGYFRTEKQKVKTIQEKDHIYQICTTNHKQIKRKLRGLRQGRLSL